MNRALAFLLLTLLPLCSFSQTTDLATSVEAQDLNGNPISQIVITQEFQYVTTIVNSGAATESALFSQTLNENIEIVSFESLNNVGGASVASNFVVNGTMISATIANMPSNSSVQIKVIVKAPNVAGGIATTASIIPDNSTTDVNPNNNDSIISINVIAAFLDFDVVYSQIDPTPGNPIANWDEVVEYEFTITNNSEIPYSISGFTGIVELNTSGNAGTPFVEFQSIECVNNTNGTACPDLSSINSASFLLNGNIDTFNYNNAIPFTLNGSLTFRIRYKYLEPNCGVQQEPIDISSYIEIGFIDENGQPLTSNEVENELPQAELCAETDVCIDTVQIDPLPGTILNYGDIIILETTVCNNGPLDAPVVFFLQNLFTEVEWEITNIECAMTTNISCDDFQISIGNQFWSSTGFVMPTNSTITIITTLFYIEPECAFDEDPFLANIRSGINIFSNELLDSDLSNNFDNDFLNFAPVDVPCPVSNLSITKTQISPSLPQGSSEDDTAAWGSIIYEIVANNPDDSPTQIEIVDLMSENNLGLALGTLVSVECVSTTGNASCQEITEVNFNTLDGEPTPDGLADIFWQITEDDNWVLPAQSSITFHVEILWEPFCSFQPIEIENVVSIVGLGINIDDDTSNNSSRAITYFAPCIDLVIQTFPEQNPVTVNQNFNWIVDISNSELSSKAIDIEFISELSPEFTITGTPTCLVSNGTATCATTIDISNNVVSGIIPEMEVASTVQIVIPVSAPNFGGAFSNIAEAIPSELNNEEITPETNISQSSVQVISPSLQKEFNPSTIVENQESTLTFTITNVASNAEQNDISFTDNLPNGVILAGVPEWENANGSTATFVGTIGDDFVGVTNLFIPEGVSFCSFKVQVTSAIPDVYINDAFNFSNQANIETSQAFSTLTVTEDLTNVDIKVIKTVTPEEANFGEEVEFTITISNLGTTQATAISIEDLLPSGFELVSFNVTSGVFSSVTGVLEIETLDPNASVTLTLIARVVSSNNLTNTASLINLNEIDRDDTNNSDSATVTIGNCLQVPEGFSPNSDAFNPTLIIPCIENYPDNSLLIYNRYGTLVYEANSYLNDWDGTSNQGFTVTNGKLPVGTYFYVLTINSQDLKRIGWVYLNY